VHQLRGFGNTLPPSEMYNKKNNKKKAAQRITTQKEPKGPSTITAALGKKHVFS